MLVMCEDCNKYRVAMPVVAKGGTGMISERVLDWVLSFGYRKIIAKSDQEPSIAALQSESRMKMMEEIRKMISDVKSITKEMTIEVHHLANHNQMGQ